MLCSLCKENEATVHLTQMVKDDIKKIDLCESCSKAKGVNDPNAFSLADLLLGLGGGATEAEGADAADEIRCPQCGFTQADFKKAGRLGCALCYTTFAEGVESLLKSMHKGTKHAGKIPQSFQQNREISEKLKQLQKKLDKAIANEDFEEAATLRDELKQAREKFGT